MTFFLVLKIQIWILLIIFIPILIGIAFITLFERKILAYRQLRKGPNKISFLGILQPISDAVKLFSAQICFFLGGCDWFFYGSPLLNLTIVCFMWSLYPSFMNLFSWSSSILLFLLALRLRLYPILLGGIARSNNYAIIGRYRRVAQIISYEIVLIIFLLILIFLVKKTSFIQIINFNQICFFIFYYPLLLFIWVFRTLAETNRTPFDFSEGESELVSGFNTEYGRWWFAYIFMAEYGIILFFRFLRSIFFRANNRIIMYFVLLLFIFFWMITRRTYPRHRFDKLISISWKSLIPLILLVLLIFIILDF